MSATIHVLHSQPASIAGFLRVEKVLETVEKAKTRLVRLRDALADLQAKEGAVTRSRSPAFRGGRRSISAVLGM